MLFRSTVPKKSNALQTAPTTENLENDFQAGTGEPAVIDEAVDEEEAGEPEAQAGDIASGTDGNINWRIDADGKLAVSGTGDCSSSQKPWYQYREQITSAEVNVSGMTDASWMFSECENLERIDFSGFDTSDMTRMDGMFAGCRSLTILNLDSFDTSNVTDMHQMFASCDNLTELDLRNFDTSNVVNMMGMFQGCPNLITLDLSNFDTSNVTIMNVMFDGCSNITALDLRNFDTSNVMNMGSMFVHCSSLTTLNLSGFDTANVTSMDGMFSGCYNLTMLNLASFDTSNVTDMSEMFRGCDNLSTLDLRNFDTSNVIYMSSMFQDCNSLTVLDLSSFDTSNVTNMFGMFYRCSNLPALDLHGFNTSNVAFMDNMFGECSNLESLDLSSFDTSHGPSIRGMFYNCSNLKTLNLSSFDTSNITSMWSLFDGCSSLTALDLSHFDTKNVQQMQYMFYGCSSLAKLDLSNFNTANVTTMKSMFEGCDHLETLDLKSFNTTNVTDMSNMFADCNGLAAIYTPYNIRIGVLLPSGSEVIWLLPDGIETSELPRNLDHSVLIVRRKNPKIITTTADLNMEDVIRVKYVPYSYTVQTDNWDETNKVTYSLVSGKLAEGLELYPATGEIYGVPLETGEFPITVKAEFSNPEYLPSYADLTLTVLDNTDGNVSIASDPGYEVEQYLGTQIFSPPGSSNYYYEIQERKDQLFISAGTYGEFVALWLNGEKLTEDKDYTKESGSTRITVRTQTLENKTNKNGTNTIAAEFRVGGDPNNDLKRTAQNFRIDFQQQNSGSGDDSSSGGGSRSRGSGSEAEVVAVSSATAVVHLVDASGNPLTGAVLELHSTPQTARTDQRGLAVFGGVTAGFHTLYIKDGSGNTLASRNFELLFGEKASISGEQVTVKAGMVFTFQVQMSGNTLLFLNVQDGNVYQVASANTGDAMAPELWLALFLLSGGIGTCIFAAGRRRRSYR